ncbi:unnamed protein product [Brassicogethes aeneus]|uniref:Uncharacterized protein n=1 Tax=Brassicogethes aeneus TaxID=1431903 RepID=A0A9P0B2R0_BRAAE|nr:unnamed protein product [Brassicogethes aeneus]
MATTLKLYILATSLTSGLALALALLALGTDHWVDATIHFDSDTDSDSSVNYGLFKGYENIRFGRTGTYEIYMTCLYDKNVCGMLCDADEEHRKNVLENFYINPDYSYSERENCVSIKNELQVTNFWRFRSGVYKDRLFINAGAQMSTLIFLVLSCVFGAMAAALAVWNTIYNPIHVWMSVTGLFVYNGLACAFTIFYVTIWGIMYAVTLCRDIVTMDTLNKQATSEGRALLGYSYWINLASMLLYALSVGLLFTRQMLISRDPAVKLEKDMETRDADIYLF